MKNCLILLASLFLSLANAPCAELTLASLFQDHLVLQRQMPVPLWGTSDPGVSITVKIGAAQASGKSDDKGSWRVDLPAMEASATGQVLTVTAGDKTVTVNDVLIGDVWVCSGQSNMALPVSGSSTAKEELAKPANPNIRLFAVKQHAAFTVQTACTGSWQIAGPDSIKGFSAVGYYFVKEIGDLEKVPVGLIGTYWGATAAQSWTSMDGLESDPVLKTTYADPVAKIVADPEGTKAAYDAWLANGGTAYNQAKAKYYADAYAAKLKGDPAPPPVTPPAAPEPPHDNDSRQPVVLFNGMIAPLIPFAIKGVVWYQGESNAGGATYAKLFPTMITDWRKHWGLDFPFIYVQLPNYRARMPEPTESGLASSRDVQLHGLELPKTGMAVTIDAGDGNNLHPPYKDIVGHRLALAAEHLVYGKDIVYSGPLLDSVKIEGATATVTFKEVGTGLKIGMPPIIPPGTNPPPKDELKGFAVAGSDRKFAWAKATITAPNTVTLTCDKVTAPEFVRYAWADNPEVNLYNSADLPAAPFRTDPPLPPPAPPKPEAPVPAK